jgi:hypothetical protein
MTLREEPRRSPLDAPVCLLKHRRLGAGFVQERPVGCRHDDQVRFDLSSGPTPTPCGTEGITRP